MVTISYSTLYVTCYFTTKNTSLMSEQNPVGIDLQLKHLDFFSMSLGELGSWFRFGKQILRSLYPKINQKTYFLYDDQSKQHEI